MQLNVLAASSQKLAAFNVSASCRFSDMELLRDETRVPCHRPVLTYHLYKRLGGNAVGSQNATLRDSPSSAMQQRSEVAGDLPSASVVESGHPYEVEEASPAGIGKSFCCEKCY